MGRRKTVTKRPSYLQAVRWIALNDNSGNDDSVEVIQGYVSTLLVAALFGADPRRVATDIDHCRSSENKERGGRE
jgi:hypothetical protein